MSYQILPNIIFIFAILGILLLILRHLPEASSPQNQTPDVQPVEERLAKKGLPAIAISKVKSFFKWWGAKLWHFALEAKDLKHSALTGYKIKKIFSRKSSQPNSQSTAAEAPNPASAQVYDEAPKDENYYLEKIKKQPKNFALYDSLGKFYLDKKSFADSKDIYLYLVSHEPANAEFQARLAHSYYKLKEFSAATEHYQKSLALDSTQPNQYYNLGLSLEAQGKLEQALSAFKQAVALEPQNSKFYLSLGNVYVKTGEIKKAKDALLEAKKLDPNNQNINPKI